MASAEASAQKTRLTRIERRETIVDAAREAFLAKGFEGARTKTIAAGAGVSEAALYQHFASKNELFEEAILKPLHAGIAGMFERLVECADELGGSDLIVAEALQREILRSVGALLPLLGVAHLSDPLFGREHYRSETYAVLAAGIRDLAGRLDWDEQLLSTMFWIATGPALDAEFREIDLPADEIARQLAPLLSARRAVEDG